MSQVNLVSGDQFGSHSDIPEGVWDAMKAWQDPEVRSRKKGQYVPTHILSDVSMMRIGREDDTELVASPQLQKGKPHSDQVKKYDRVSHSVPAADNSVRKPT